MTVDGEPAVVPRCLRSACTDDSPHQLRLTITQLPFTRNEVCMAEHRVVFVADVERDHDLLPVFCCQFRTCHRRHTLGNGRVVRVGATLIVLDEVDAGLA